MHCVDAFAVVIAAIDGTHNCDLIKKFQTVWDTGPLILQQA